MKAANRMIWNTCVMYARVCVTMVVTLLSSRWILMALGEEDFGIYNLVAGLLSLLMFLNLSMSTATQRFLSFYLVKDGATNANEVFYISCVLHFIVGILVVLTIEILGQILLNTFLNVPQGKLGLALFVLHTLSISTFFTIVSVPYNASLLAHENMFFVACVNIIEALLKLGIAIFLLNYNGQRLILYTICLMSIQIISTLIYRIYCISHYPETKIRIRKIRNTTVMKEMLSYVGWNLIGSISSLCRTQGISMLLNSFYGVAINAAYGIATQVKGQLSFFSSAIVSAARPQIVKSEGEGNRRRMLELSNSTSKLTFLMLSMIAVPLIIEMPYVLKLWLKDVPAYTVSFTRLILILNLVFQLCIGTSIGMESVGKIKTLQIIVGGMHFLVLPIGYYMLMKGMAPYTIFIMVIIEEAVGLFIRLLISHRVTGLDVWSFITDVLLPSVFSFVFVFLLCKIVQNAFEESFIRVVFVSSMSIVSMGIISFAYVLNKKEKDKIRQMTVAIRSKFLK